MQASTQGKNSWQEGLYEAKAAHFVLYGRALGLSHWEAEDVLQETFVALSNVESPPDLPHQFALTCYRNRARNYKRGLWRRVRREMESSHWFERESTASPQERAAMHCLARLPREQAEVIVLKIWHQHTFEAIGRLLDISPNTAAGRYRYGMGKLKNALQTFDHEHTSLPREAAQWLDAATTVGLS